jgi:hypothetical protein
MTDVVIPITTREIGGICMAVCHLMNVDKCADCDIQPIAIASDKNITLILRR